MCNNFTSEPVFVVQSSLSVLLKFKLPMLLAQKCVKLVIIDSLAALFRVEFSHKQTSERANLLLSFGAQLHSFSDQYGAAVVCINQVRMKQRTCMHDCLMCICLFFKVTSEVGGGLKPSLGLAWANIVTTRLIMHRDETLQEGEVVQEVGYFFVVISHSHPSLYMLEQDTPQSPRTLRIAFAPHLPQGCVDYYITVDGIKGYLEQSPLHAH